MEGAVWHRKMSVSPAQPGLACPRAPAPRGPWPCLPVFPATPRPNPLFVPGWGRWGAEARGALMCHSARRHGSWAQRAGTSGTRAGRQLQRRLRLTSQHGAALFLPGEAGTVPGARPPLGYVPNKAHGEQRAGGGTAPGDWGCLLYKRAGAAPGWGGRWGDRETPGVARGATQLQSLQLLHRWSRPRNWFNWEPPWEETGPGWEPRQPASSHGARRSLPTAKHRAGAAAVAV